MGVRQSAYALAKRAADAVPLAPGQTCPPSFGDIYAPQHWAQLVALFQPTDEALLAQPDRLAALRRQLEAQLGEHADHLQHYVNAMCNIGTAELEGAYLIGVALGRRCERLDLAAYVSAPAQPIPASVLARLEDACAAADEAADAADAVALVAPGESRSPQGKVAHVEVRNGAQRQGD